MAELVAEGLGQLRLGNLRRLLGLAQGAIYCGVFCR
jgi:hypothetical protein